MASVALRDRVYAVLSTSPELEATGLVPGSVYPAFSPDSPQERVWMVLRWGPASPGIGDAASIDLALWVYDREERYDRIERSLRAARPLMEALVAVRLSPPGSGAVLGIGWQGAGPDLFDDVYPAWTRYESYRVTASGG